MQHWVLSAKTFNSIQIALRQALCLALLCMGLFSVLQTLQLSERISAQRLLEVSVQDLILQSHALHYVGDTRPTLSHLFLESRGYASTMEVLNQLDARLAILEKLQMSEPLSNTQKGLRVELEKLIQTHREGLLPNRPSSPEDTRATVNLWFSNLYGLNNQLKLKAAEEQSQFLALQGISITSGALLVILGGVMLIAPWWRASTLRRRVQHELEQFANKPLIDPLTGVLNQQGWRTTLGSTLQNPQSAAHQNSSLAILHIDYFKHYNDTFGAEAGDKRLKAFADHLKTNFRPSDIIARIGQEEFAVLLPGCSAEETHFIVERVRQNEFCEVGFSAGICKILDDQTVDRIMAMADQALYQAKHKGMNQSHVAQ